MLNAQQSAYAELALPSEEESLAYLAEVEKSRATLRARTITLDMAKEDSTRSMIILIMAAMLMLSVLTTFEAGRRLVEIDRDIALAVRV